MGGQGWVAGLVGRAGWDGGQGGMEGRVGLRRSAAADGSSEERIIWSESNYVRRIFDHLCQIFDLTLEVQFYVGQKYHHVGECVNTH